MASSVFTEMMDMTDIFVNRRKCTALVDTGCIQMLVSRFMCHSKKPGEVNVLAVDGKTLKCCRQSYNQLGINGIEPVHVEALVVDRLGFNLILKNDAIRMAGGVTITSAGVVGFAGKKATMYAAICLSEPDFCAEFDQTQNCWTAKWKWSRGWAPDLLHNKIQEYKVPK